MNRLSDSTSPYLLQHAHNPVDWFPWSPEAFERAAAENKPVFLSVGYSACHWCHVMERESFENESVAEILNREFVSIKVDREERPDIDEIFMTATQLLTGSGGWPNSVFLTPDKRPFYAGTYFPPDDRWGRPGFKNVLAQIASAFKGRRAEIEKQAGEIAAAMRSASSGGPADPVKNMPLSRGIVADTIEELERSFDSHRGGFGGAPKFPPHSALELLIYDYAVQKDERALEMAVTTLDAMGRGGIYDHLGGGFARYSTDEEWLVPHFEKMLYDNAQLIKVYAEAWVITKKDRYRRIVSETIEWVLREMRDPGGAFYSAIDADSEGEEGKFYLWTRGEIIGVLGAERGIEFCDQYNVSERGNFIDPHVGHYDERNILHLKSDEAADASDCLALRQVRDRRVRPGLDDKILVSWNGLMIEGMARAGRLMGEPRFTKAAGEAADYILGNMISNDRLLATARKGKAKLNAYLDDYVFFAAGLIELNRIAEARQMIEVVLDRFADPNGGFFFTSDDHEELLYRWKDPFDKAIPSGNGKAAQVFFKLFEASRDDRYLTFGVRLIEHYSGLMSRAHRGMQSFVLATAQYFDHFAPSFAEALSRSAVTASSRVLARSENSATIELNLAIHEGWTIKDRQIRLDDGTVLEKVEDQGDSRMVITVQSPNPLPQKLTMHLNYQACTETECREPESVPIVVALA